MPPTKRPLVTPASRGLTTAIALLLPLYGCVGAATDKAPDDEPNFADGVVHVGSENMSTTSLTKNREVGAFVFEPLPFMKLQSQFDADWGGATQL